MPIRPQLRTGRKSGAIRKAALPMPMSGLTYCAQPMFDFRVVFVLD